MFGIFMKHKDHRYFKLISKSYFKANLNLNLGLIEKFATS